MQFSEDPDRPICVPRMKVLSIERARHLMAILHCRHRLDYLSSQLNLVLARLYEIYFYGRRSIYVSLLAWEMLRISQNSVNLPGEFLISDRNHIIHKCTDEIQKHEKQERYGIERS